MTAETLFSIANPLALLGWAVLVWAVIRKNQFLRDEIAGRWWPLSLSSIYALLIIFFFARAEGGFDTLANVQKLFTMPWLALAGWIHYLAFDLFVGAWISKCVMDEALPRWLLIVLLPLTFMFGPIGFLGFHVSRLTFRKLEKAQ